MKIIGCVLILLTSGLTGLFLSHRLYEKVRFWEEWLTFLRQTETQIRFGARPLEEIFGEYRGGFLPARYCAGAMERGLSFHSAWEQGLKPFPLQEDEKALLQKWGDELGGSDTQGQMTLCSAMRAEAEERKTKARKEAVEKSRMIRTLSLCAGAAVILLLL